MGRAAISTPGTHPPTGPSNGPTEGLNSIIKKIKRVAASFRNFAHYQTRILHAIGGCNWILIGATPR